MKIETFTALPTTPEKLAPLLEIASNMWFSWNWDVTAVFSKLDKELWIKADKNPLRMLCDIPQSKLEEAAENKDYIAEVDAVYTSYKKYIEGKTWFDEKYGGRKNPTIAYFSCEFGIHESLPIYSGGLGVLAGDHLKSASDLGIPLVAVGFLYRQGYFRQGLNADGIQQEFYPENDIFSMPIVLQKNKDETPLLLSMDLGGEEVFYQIWKVQVGRIDLFLIDTNVTQNKPQIRDITKRLYEADRNVRIRQEILLGMGGVKALKALNITPAAYHINEGHSAFLILERLRALMEEQFLTFEEAKEVVWATNIFTTHTPVPAGNERFDCSLVKNYLGKFVQKRLGLSWNDFLSFGRENPTDMEEDFCLTVLALKFSSHANGVAKLHGEISRDMWHTIYNDIPKDEVPIKHITNGVHTKTWLNKNFEQLFARYLQTAYVREIADFTLWKVAHSVPDMELWSAHQDRKNVLIEYVRHRIRFQLERRGAGVTEISRVKNILNPNSLTIGFARRFAPYKRGSMLFEDLDRINAIINNAKQPVQFIFAGKAHPADSSGKEIIKQISNITKNPEFYKSVVFLEDYDIDMARFLVQGVDVWLNNPRRPQEASGTSGMKAAMNGALNLSILDGWWDEAFDGTNGWAIGHGEEYDDLEYQNSVEANLIYRLLEREVVPLYYDRNEVGLPEEWIQMMKNSIQVCGEGFNSHRMVSDYLTTSYLKAEKMNEIMMKDDCINAKEIATWRNKLLESWEKLEIIEVAPLEKESVYAGSDVSIKAKVNLNNLKPENLIIEVYHGNYGADGIIKNPTRTEMSVTGTSGATTIYETNIPCVQGGRYGYTVRALPGHKNLSEQFIPDFIKWYE